jgi:hypothetical protein
MSEREPDRGRPEREDEDDHDLLTYGEAGARLEAEVGMQRDRVSALTAAGPSDELDQATARLTALEEAAERNRRQPINDDNFERFFGYKGSAKRNT